MWDCSECGTVEIISSEPFCPHCFKPRPAITHGTPTETEEEVVQEPRKVTPATVIPAKKEWGK